ncbi:MAG TPA: hypothetical protein GX400_18700 [Chloroflexi bacterium]|nr:hypothetical protein [Chloroflexota bacterium]
MIQEGVAILKGKRVVLSIALTLGIAIVVGMLIGGRQSVFAQTSDNDGTVPSVVDATADEGMFTQFLPLIEHDHRYLCRFGVNVVGAGDKDISRFNVGALRVGWYINYLAESSPTRPGGIDYTPVIRLRKSTDGTTYTYSPNGAELTAAINANPGAAWMIGNEPDRRDAGQPVQDEMPPALYAQAYHELYTLLKQQDPTARIFAGSIVQPTPLRIKYLDLVLESYQQQYGTAMPVDGWAIHNFILNERSCAAYNNDLNLCWGADIPPGLNETDGLIIENTLADLQKTVSLTLFKEQIVRFRQWMLDNGYRNKPLYLTEFGVLMPAEYGFPPSTVNTFMNQTFEYLLTATNPQSGYPPDGNRLVQRFSWYSTSDNVSFNGYLFEQPALNQPYVMTEMGQNYRTFSAGVTDQIDLTPIELTPVTVTTASVNNNVTVNLSVKVANSANLLTPQRFVVDFYHGNPDAGGVLLGASSIVQVNGCGESATANMTWTDVAPGTYTVYARVRSLRREDVTTNNTISTSVVVTAPIQTLTQSNRVK